jgi:L-iditol 2-dehydrogenase
MKQAVMTSPGAIEFREVPVPKPRANEVLVRVKRIGVCGSDIHVFHGRHPLTPYPVVQGHEVSGVVEEAGSEVQGLGVADKVTFQPQVTCGKCYSCLHGAYHICDNLKVMGFQTTGAASEFFAVEAAKVLKLPPGMDLDHGAMVEPVAVGVHALSRSTGMVGKNVLILGAGPIGNLAAQVAAGLGAAKIMITDLSDYRLQVAERCGIELRVNAGGDDVAVALRTHFGPDRADVILECVGAQQSIDQAVAVARKGTDIIVVGVFGEHPRVDLGTVQDRELRLIGTLMYQQADWKKAIALIDAGKVRLQPVITDHFRFVDYHRAYKYIEEHRDHALKVMIDLD